MNARPTITHGDAVERVVLAMLTTAASINRPAVLRALDAAAQFLRAIEAAVMLYAGDDDDEGAAVTAVVNDAMRAMLAATHTDGRDPLDGTALAAVVVTLVCGMGPDCGAVIAEQAMPGELSADAERVDAWRAMFATVGGVA